MTDFTMDELTDLAERERAHARAALRQYGPEAFFVMQSQDAKELSARLMYENAMRAYREGRLPPVMGARPTLAATTPGRTADVWAKCVADYNAHLDAVTSQRPAEPARAGVSAPRGWDKVAAEYNARFA
jgi:hypothetical protein